MNSTGLPSRKSLRFGAFAFFCLIVLYFLRSIDSPERPVSATFFPSTYDWSKFEFYYPLPPPAIELPKARPHSLAKIQHDFGTHSTTYTHRQAERQHAVRQAFLKSWNSYKQHAWMRDELAPLTGGWKDPFGGWAASLVDALDTIHIMGLQKEFGEAVRAAATIDWSETNSTSCNLFETTIRHLGGLLSAYDLSHEPALLAKARELGDMLYASFDNPTNLPPFWFDWARARAGTQLADDHEPSTTAGTLAVEFTRLAQLTGNSKYYDVVARVENLLYLNQNHTLLPGMLPTFFNLRVANFTYDNTFTLGALSDSMHEYIPKMFALLAGTEPMYEDMYRTMAETIKKHLLFRPMNPENLDILFSGTVTVHDSIYLNPEGQHLACFAGGMFALGGRLFNLPEHVDIGARLTKGCIWGYDAFTSGLLPEIFRLIPCNTTQACVWNEEHWSHYVKGNEHLLPKGFRAVHDPRYILRPEAIESVFILYRITGEDYYREAAWRMFKAIMFASETDLANAAIKNVLVNPPEQVNSMESFWFAETLKYFYLIFSPPDLISLDDWVFNTEAHPMRIPKP